MSDQRHLVIGLGEIGHPLFRFLRVFGQGIEVYGRDIAQSGLEPADWEPGPHVIHICFPYSESFVDYVLTYIRQYKPDLCIIHSTVQPGTTDAIAQQVNGMMAYSPIRGRHGGMERDLLKYRKFVASPTYLGEVAARETLRACGFEVEVMDKPAALELAKILETTYSGLLIAWAQEMERYADTVGAEFWHVVQFLAEPPHLPRVIFQPGHIGGHCIMQNLELLNKVMQSDFVDAIWVSNQEVPKGDGRRLWPVPVDELIPSQGGCACQNLEAHS